LVLYWKLELLMQAGPNYYKKHLLLPHHHPSTSSPPPSPTNTTLSPQDKSKLCDPNNPKLRFVNTTESHLCNIPKTMKNVTTTTPTPTSIPSPTPKPILPLLPNPITPPSENPPQEAPIPGIL
jgi:hypothetical protein